MKTEDKTDHSPDAFPSLNPISPSDRPILPGSRISEHVNHLRGLIESRPFFQGLTADQYQFLADSALEVAFEKDQWLFAQGDPANRFYLILEGSVALESEVKDRGTVPIRTLGPDDDLGWAWLFPPYYMMFSARALSPVRAISFYGTKLRQQCEDDYNLGYALMKRIAETVVCNLNATQQRLLECVDVRKIST